MKEERPRLNIPLNVPDYIQEGLSLAAVFLIVFIPIKYFTDLPDIIPIHFNLEGEPDNFGTKKTIFLLPAISIALYIFMTGINKYPHTFNYTHKITPENAFSQYRAGTRLIRFVKLLILVSFLYLEWITIRTAMGQEHGMGHGFTLLFFASLTGTIIAYFYTTSKIE